MSIAECSHLYKRYGKCEVVSDLSFRVDEGEILGLLGPNGAGKTTTIKILLGLTAADSGTIRIKEGEYIGYSPETPYFHRFLTGREVLRFYCRLQKIEKFEAEEQINQLLDAVGLEDSGDKKTGTYSKGMLQRLAAAQAMLGDPGLLILDEPTSGLDAIGRMEMIRLILDLKRKGRSVIINSHILSDVEKVADRVVFIVKGRNAGEVDKHEYMESGLESFFLKAAGMGSDKAVEIETDAKVRTGAVKMAATGEEANGEDKGRMEPVKAEMIGEKGFTEPAADRPTGGSEDLCVL